MRRQRGRGPGYGKRRIMCVYYLRDPLTDEVRYIGSTNNYVRRMENWQNVFKHPERYNVPTDMLQWIKELDGKFPRPQIVCHASTRREAFQLERDHIGLGVIKGWRLVNVLDRRSFDGSYDKMS